MESRLSSQQTGRSKAGHESGHEEISCERNCNNVKDENEGEDPTINPCRQTGAVQDGDKDKELTNDGQLDIQPSKEGLIENWLGKSSYSQQPSALDMEALPRDLPHVELGEYLEILSSPSSSSICASSSTRSSKMVSASVHDWDYRTSLSYRNIYIEFERAPAELIRRAREIIERPRASSETDDATAEEFIHTLGGLQTRGEDDIADYLTSVLIPTHGKIPDKKLEMNFRQLWHLCVPIPLEPDLLITPRPLPRPKPDHAFGYSEIAFTKKQLEMIELLVDDTSGNNYARPSQAIRFPFLGIEFKSQAKKGTNFFANNQAAGAGAIASNGYIELLRRSLGDEALDLNEPQYFSIVMDQELVRINVHWMSGGRDGKPYAFHVRLLAIYLLMDVAQVKGIARAVKNILEYGVETRLPRICAALDVYRAAFIAQRER